MGDMHFKLSFARKLRQRIEVHYFITYSFTRRIISSLFLMQDFQKLLFYQQLF